MRHYTTSLFIFRRDLRLDDNTALMAAMAASEQVIPCFIFDPRQTEDHPYKSAPGFDFLIDALIDLNAALNAQKARLYVGHGRPDDILPDLIKKCGIQAVYVNADYTPFSRARDAAIAKVCQDAGIIFQPYHDCMLNPPDAVRKDDGGVYTVFTPYARKALTHAVTRPVDNRGDNYFRKDIPGWQNPLPRAVKKLGGGRQSAAAILKRLKTFHAYAEERDFPANSATTRLSVHHKFGTCSIRESYWAARDALGPGHTLIKEFIWRDFFMMIGFHFPHVFEGPFHIKYKGMAWDNNKKLFELWCKGQTGFPIVDAGMRELNATGFMHNRVRMITASFLIKDLHIDWRWGERYFATKLIDYDPLVNNGNWQWAASTGCDAQPYFRIFNPWLQQAKFDPEARYIKTWVPELKNILAKDIHTIYKKEIQLDNYPPPIVWHDAEKAKALKQYRSIS